MTAATLTIRLSAAITVRLQPGILFVFTPEWFSRHPECRSAWRRNPQPTSGTQISSTCSTILELILVVDAAVAGDWMRIKISHTVQSPCAIRMSPQTRLIGRIPQVSETSHLRGDSGSTKSCVVLTKKPDCSKNFPTQSYREELPCKKE